MYRWPAETPEPIARVARFLRTQPGEAWIVGGCVRDALVGRAIEDVDVTARNAAALGQAFAEATRSTCVQLYYDPATVAVMDRETGARVDFAELRAFSIEGDLQARDYTVNAIAIEGRAEQPVVPLDPCGGLADIEARQMRLISEFALVEDPLRLLRAFRLAAELGFTIEDETLRTIEKRADLAAEPSGERIRDELGRMFAVRPHPEVLRQFVATGVAEEVTRPCGVGVEGQVGAHERGRALVEEMMASEYGRQALLDLVHSRRLQPWLMFACWLGPQAMSDARDLADALRTSRVQRAGLLAYTRNDITLDSADRRSVAHLWGELSEHSLGLAIRSAAWDDRPDSTWRQAAEMLAAEVYPESLKRPLVTGTDLMADLGLYGPALGCVLAELRARQLAGELHTPEEALRAARKWAG